LLVAADLAVTIPMRGSASSLNVAVATALLLYEIGRQGAKS
jgi:tRNA G18 (ribose-2'-O)-methylase SpoU